MTGPTVAWRHPGRTRCAAGVVFLLVGLIAAPAVRGQQPAPVMTAMDLLTPAAASSEAQGTEVIPAGCASCGSGGGLLGPPPVGADTGGGGCSSCGRSPCVPNHKPCCPCDQDTWLGRFGCCIYECICCPDPCYEPRWTAIADSAFFVESARPITQQRLRWDYASDMPIPDRSEYFWARENVPILFGSPSVGKGPQVPQILIPQIGQIPPVRQQYFGEIKLNYNELGMYTEVASKFLSFFVEIPYLSIDPELVPHAAGFTDMNLGTKSLMYDCELLQLTFQMKTYLPTGNFTKGLGNGHVTLEPSVILNVKCGPDSYVQSQIAEWVPLGGDAQYAGAILHYHVSYNHVLCRPVADTPIIGTLEFNGWSFQDGAYTDPFLGPYQQSSGNTYLSVGPGFRWFFCDKIDFGVGSAFALTKDNWGKIVLRSEIRWRF
jgi:hypothetical protein